MEHDLPHRSPGTPALRDLWTWLPRPVEGPLIGGAALLLATIATLLGVALAS